MADKLIWSPEKKGFYSVKTSYWIARASVLENVLVSTSHGNPFQELWGNIWKAQVPEKVKICIWRACSSLLPTRAKLQSKGYTGDRNCLLCTHKYEDTSHVFCQCPIATSVLAAPPFSLGRSLFDFREWMLDHALNLKQDEFCKARNVEKTNVARTKPSWQPPAEGSWKLNVDGSFLPSIPKGGVGGVLRDNTGRFHVAFAIPVSSVASAKHTELLAIKEGLALLQTLQTGKVVIESDCLEAVKNIANVHDTHIVEAALIDDVRVALCALTSVTVQHAPRACNRVAHRLASMAYEARTKSVWYNQAPEDILDVLNYDCNQS
ncbi:uncharacterized protein LOC133744429 [Rosa rugosa]|uniref:uncharacterized protein LOC133744429 n=1 Tax=Rosa rugosa TaxID=74645 RepID=UPI002B400B64|nr:uncharacterized protein LOC133744429 [Rosa rugosa]